MRERLFTMRMSAEESERLDAVAKHFSLNAAGVIRMLVKEKHDTIMRETAADVRRHAVYWQRDRDRIEQLVELSGVAGLAAVFDDARQLVTLTSGRRSVARLSKDDAEIEIAQWPGSKIVGWSGENNPIVVRNVRAAEKWIRSHGDADWANVACDELSANGFEEVSL